MLTGTRAEHLHLRCFIEGEEVPIISANVTQPVQGSASAHIQLPGTPEALHMKPRSIVEVYYKQNGPTRSVSGVKKLPTTNYVNTASITDFGSVAAQAGVLGVGSPITNTLDTIIPIANALASKLYRPVSEYDIERDLQYDLLFAGELVGYTYYQDTQTRVINLMCTDFVAHLDYLNQFTFDTNHVLEMGSQTRLKILAGFGGGKGKVTYDGASADGFYIEQQVLPGTISATNSLGLLNVFNNDINGDDVFDLDTSAGTVLGLEAKIAYAMGRYGVKAGYKYIFSKIAEKYVFYRDIDQEINLRDMVFMAHDSLTSEFFKNEFFVSTIFQGQSRSGTMNSVRNLMKIVFRQMHFEFTPIASCALYESSSLVNRSKDFLLDDPKKKVKGTPATAIAKYMEAVEVRDVGLKQCLIKPEIPFAEPPACNTIFPDELYALNFTRHYLAEPTRGIEYTDQAFAAQEGNAGVKGLDQLTAQLVMVPSVIIDEKGRSINYAPPEMFDLINKMDKYKTLDVMATMLLPEEVYKGIIPLISQTSHLMRTAVIMALNGGTPTADGDGVVDAAGTVGITGAIDQTMLDKITHEYFVYEANYKWLCARYEGRTAEVSCTFLPRLQVGFPAFIAEKDNRPERLSLPKTTMFGYFGSIQQVSHSVSQAGGVTSVMLTHMRPTNDALDFIQVKGTGQEERIDGSAVQLIPDLRVMGSVPWARAEYGPDVIGGKYHEWLGGLGWTGESTKEDPNERDEYFGTLPLSQAIEKIGFNAQVRLELGKSALLESTGGHQSVQKMLVPIKGMLLTYGQNHIDGGSSGKTRILDDRFRRLCARPVANRLQLRAFFNAYYSVESLDPSTVTDLQGQSQWRARQSVFRALGYYNGETNGIVTADTRRAIIQFKEYLRDNLGATDVPLNADWTSDMDQLLLLKNIAPGAAKIRVRAVQATLLATLHPDLIVSRRARRNTRLKQVIDYKASLQSAGSGLRG